MELETLCDYCGEKTAVAKCGVCGSMVCSEHKLPHGCSVCGGGEQKF
ncbi:MAG: hypothetical protein ABEJ03_03720 [Candidatus Nanohaloarchaea archaeon]